ncbi:peptidoglycan editing factor PgeF [Shewanella maritima]|uniref:peptidoglycan editing factor PgeF n=1 Tax=Shewanella maritima TaxID=2520507 RepID=UPI003735CBD8
MWQHDWPVPDNIGLVFTDRFGGISQAPYAELNLGAHVGDESAHVSHNRDLLVSRYQLPSAPVWLEQVHSTKVLSNPDNISVVAADGSFTNQAHTVCAVMTADCLPVVICNQEGTEVSAVHAGWRGLCEGIIENALQLFDSPANSLIAYLGPAIGPNTFEVGAEVRAAFIKHDPKANECFIASGDKYLADIYQLAAQRLQRFGVQQIFSANECTVSNPQFFSYRRQAQTGRQATLVWLKS